MRPDRFKWTDEMLAALRRERRKGVPYRDCVDIIGVSYNTLSRKCRELGISGRMNKGRKSASDVIEDENDG